MNNIFMLFLWLGVSFSAGWFGSQFRPGAWYESLQKPSWTPPPIAFPIAWTILYALMGTAAWSVWNRKSGGPIVGAALILFIAQLILNSLWSWIFFGRHQIGWALVEISALWVAIAATTYFFWRISVMAGLLMMPYLLWVGFAVALNWAIWTKN